MGIWTAWRVVISKPVNQCNLRVPTNDGGYINGFRLASLQGGNYFKLLQDRMGLGGVLRLRCTNHNIFTPLMPSASLIEHLEGFTNSSSIAKEHFQLATSLPPLFKLDLCEQLIWAGSLRRIFHH